MGRIEAVRLYPTYPQEDMSPFMVLAHDESNDAYSGEVLRGDAQAVPIDVRWVLRDGRTAMTNREAREFVEDYVFPPERQNADGMLRDLGLEEYDPWRIFTIVHRRALDHCGFMVGEVEVLHDEPGRLDR